MICLKTSLSLLNCKKSIKRKLAIFLLFVVFILTHNIIAQQRQYKFNHLTVDEGLSHTDALEVKQDKLGFIWIATFFGLDRFDGYRIKRFVNNAKYGNGAFKNRIRSLYPDENGNIWLLTEDGVQCFNSRTEKFVPLKQNKIVGATDGYFKIIKLNSEKLVLLYQNKIKVLKIDGNSLQDITTNLITNLTVFDFTVDSAGTIWFISDKGLFALNSRMNLHKYKLIIDGSANTAVYFSKLTYTRKGSLLLISDNVIVETSQTAREILREKSMDVYGRKRYHNASLQIKDVLLDIHNDCWLSTYQGLVHLDANWNYLQTITNKSQNNGLTSNFLGKLFTDKSQCLWICTYGGGVNFIDLNAKRFNLLQRNPERPNTLPDNYICSVVEEDQNNIWIGLNLNGICRYNLKTNQFFEINANSGSVRLSSNEIKSLAIDKFKRLWIGSRKGIQILGTSRLSFENLPGLDSFPKHSIENLAMDYFGNMWFGSFSHGLGRIVYENGVYKTKFYNITKHKEGASSDRINYIYCDQNRPEIFISTANGLERFKIGNDGTVKQFFQYKYTNKSNSLSSNYVWPVQRQSDNVIWVGTLGGGLNKIVLKDNESYLVNIFNQDQNIFSDVESLQIDNQGNIWLGGKGLQCLNPNSGSLISYNIKDGLQGNSFKVGSSHKGQSGRLYFGGINGLNYFYPAEIKKNTINASPLITDIIVNNDLGPSANNNQKHFLNKSNIADSKEIQLDYKENNITIFFSSMHYANPEKCLYKYKLEGIDEQWKYTKNPSVTYSNLDYKNYNFLLAATNNDGLWNKNKVEMQIDVMPPWWKSNLAVFIYFLLLTALCYGIYLYLLKWYGLKNGIAKQEIEEKRRKELDVQKEAMHQKQLQFFTNISHEFRTPLTLILGPLEMILKSEKDPKITHHLEGMHRNAKRMMNLIAELMNFKKIEDNAINLQVAAIDIGLFVKTLAAEFEEVAAQKRIQFTNTYDIDNIEYWADQQVLEKILYNLVDNAFKYSTSGGEISLKVFSNFEEFESTYKTEFKVLHEIRATKYIYFLVKDNGIGLSGEAIKHVLDRYYRVDNTHVGSGVGLALVKNLLELHKGDIYLYSQKNKGTEIIVGIPATLNNYQPSEIRGSVKNNSVLEKITTLQPFAGNELSESRHLENKLKNTILIVEDNDELRLFLKIVLEPFYQVIATTDGQKALDLVMYKKPDLIISDIMMPNMNGIELCKVIKETFETSHLPFILLTAKKDIDSQIEGVTHGADYYMSKPFSTDLLVITIQNIFSQRQKMKDLFADGFYEDAARLVQSDVDKRLMQKLMDIIEENIENEELNIDFICSKLYISRSRLYEKVKIVSGQSVGDFIRSARLKRALIIMTHEQVILQDVIERVGMNSSSYFSKAFKREFGKSPSEYLKKLKK